MSRSTEGPNIEVVCMGMGLENEKLVVSGHGKAPEEVNLEIGKVEEGIVTSDGTIHHENGELVTAEKVNFENIKANRKARGIEERQEDQGRE